ncbi:ribulose-bisphosphate carboxylase large subunit family protein [Bacillus solitudinis]|uniref:ribulose-bisphosphate carboxylase large subunit family protein n=1 Tax=Bacillus solitudinis TaxID=2014074 RepID=UPI000C249D47|nr:ribulose-bisphosphate carboxylase large subunit family protein [Bacillus solitudinis]
MNEQRVIATYYIETPYDLHHAAAVMAGEQSTGTFTAVPGETDELKEKHAAKVISIKEVDVKNTPGLPGVKLPKQHNGSYHCAEVVLSFPLINFGPSIPNLLSAIAGNLYELQEFSGLRLIDLELPQAFSEKYTGPKFGIDGTRKLANVYARPLFGTIIKPSIGLELEDLRLLARELLDAGVDFIKDDELNGNPPYAPLKERVKVVMEEINRNADKTGKKAMFAFNITGDIDELKQNHDLVYEAGGTCVMVSINSIGLAGLAHLNRYTELPIHGHRNQWGLMTRCPQLGMDFNVYQKLCRLAGADHLHVNGLNSKFYESNESVVRSIKACLTPINGGASMPVISSGQWGGTAIETYEATKTTDVIHLAGGGILSHPDGPSEGVKSMQQGWEAAINGISLEEHAKKNRALARAIEKFQK